MKITVLHSSNTRESGCYTTAEAAEALANGQYYEAGTVEVGVTTDNGMLEQAWMLTENDRFPNALQGADGSILTDDIRSLDEGDLEYLMSLGAKPLPAKWNGEFAQRSSQTGDVFLLEGVAYMAVMVGFEVIDNEPEGDYTLGKNDYDNRVESGINSEFDSLVYAGT